MKIVSLVVRLECDFCHCTGSVPGGQREYGELVACPRCHGKQTIPGEVLWDDFEKLIRGLAATIGSKR